MGEGWKDGGSENAGALKERRRAGWSEEEAVERIRRRGRLGAKQMRESSE